MAQRISLFLDFLARLIVSIIKRQKLFVSKRTLENRRKLCSLCPYRAENTCMVCGCYIKYKTKFKDSGCPKGVW